MVFGKLLPSVIVRGCRNSTSGKDGLGLEEHLLARGKDGTVSDHEILDDLGVRDDNKELVPKPKGVEGTKFLCPIVHCKFRIVG